MKLLINCLVVISLFACVDTSIYPKEILDNEISEQYNSAKWEMYKLFLRCAKNKEEEKVILSTPINFWGIDTLGPDLIIHFHNNNLNDFIRNNNCFQYNGIGFDNAGEISSFSHGDGVVLKYDQKIIADAEKQFGIKINEHNKALTPWLEVMARNKGIL